MRFLRRLFNQEPQKRIETYSDFWAWFVENEQVFYEVIKSRTSIPEAFIKPVNDKLNELRSECYYVLVGIADENRVELVISAEGVVRNFAFVDDLINEAPSLPNWQFTPLKPAIDLADMAIRMGDIEFRREKIKFYPIEEEGYPDLISLKITHEDFTEEKANLITNGVYIYMDHILGERNFASIIDAFDVVSESSIQAELVPIEKINDYLIWRQKEFIEKYYGKRKETDNHCNLFKLYRMAGILVIISFSQRVGYKSKFQKLPIFVCTKWSKLLLCTQDDSINIITR